MNSHCPNPHTLPDGTTYNVLHMVGPTGPKYDIVAFPPTPQEGKSKCARRRLATCATPVNMSCDVGKQ